MAAVPPLGVRGPNDEVELYNTTPAEQHQPPKPDQGSSASAIARTRKDYEKVNPPRRKGSTKAEKRASKWGVQNTGARLKPEERVGKCMRTRSEPTVSIVKTEHGAHYSGLHVCGSVWHCPVCAAKIGERRREEVQKAVAQWIDEGGAVAMLTLTIPHTRADALGDLIAQMQDAKARWRRGNPFKRRKQQVGWAFDIQALEVTHGDNGWHVHTHMLVFMDSGHTASEVKGLFLERWQDSCERAGLGRPSNRGLDVKVRDDAEAAEQGAKYLVKELVYGSKKKGRKGGLSPMQMLEEIHGMEGSADPQTIRERQRLERLWMEYADRFKGRQQLRWSDGAKEYFGVDDQDDQELAEEEREEGEQVIALGREAWVQVVREDARTHLLNLAENGGADAVRRWLLDRGLREASELEQTRSAKPWRFGDPL